MGTQRWAILVGIVMLQSCGQKSSEPAPAAGSAAPATSPKAAISAPERPALIGSGSDDAPASDEPETIPAPVMAPASTTQPAANPSKEFDRQTRDPSWAGPTEIEIKKRVTKLGGNVDAAECRHDRCLIALRGSEEQMSEWLAKLESPKGLQGFAQSIYLTAPVEQNGKLVVRAYATFDR